MAPLKKVVLYGCTQCLNCWSMAGALRWNRVEYSWLDINDKMHKDWVNQLMDRKSIPAETEVNLPILTKNDKLWFNVGGPANHLNVAKEIKDA